MKHILGMVLAAGLSFGFPAIAVQDIAAASEPGAMSNIVPVASKCMWYHKHYYCRASQHHYGCIWYHGYAYCPAPPPYSGGGGGSGGY